MKSWFITGASSVAGLKIARLALARGDNVVATAHRKTGIIKALGGPRPNLLALKLSATDGPSAGAAIAAGVERFGRIDILVNAGFDVACPAEQIADLEDVFRYGVLRLLTIIQAALPHMSARRAGHIVNIFPRRIGTLEIDERNFDTATFAAQQIFSSLCSDVRSRSVIMTTLNDDQSVPWLSYLSNIFEKLE